MQRLDVRCQVNLPVNIILDNISGRGMVEKKAKFSELSLSGAYLDYPHPHPGNKIIGLKYELPKYGEFEIMGEIVRKDQSGIATKFYNVNRDAKLKLWDYIRENIDEKTTCPYCSVENTRKLRTCNSCGWNLNFHSPHYFLEHEKESFLNRLGTRCSSFTLEDICKVLNFIDVEILKVGKCLDINEEFVGSSRPMLEVFSMIRNVATTDLPVVIIGENGTGREMTASAIHERSLRKDKPFVPINCAAIPGELLESELFGYEKGAFSADRNNGRTGKIEYANGGTLFLNEIEALTPDIQPRFLKFFDNKIIEKIGAKTGTKADVRLIVSASSDPRSAASKGYFGSDLISMLNTFTINLPPVSERGDDKIILARYFLNKFSKEMGVSKTFSRDAIDAIKNYDWPGNVREVIAKVRKSVVVSTDQYINPQELDLHLPHFGADGYIATLRDARDTIEKQKLIEALVTCNNNITKVAKALGISRPSVYSLKKKFGI
ncbi:MAG: sigma 54-interacting transcriptional regulator [Nitrospirae bacterium]|nr:sigma 54-interacting transcriptional regulator [Nitrospirota bacterium]